MQIDENGNLLKKQTYDTGEDMRLMHSEETPGEFYNYGYTRKDITKDIHDAVLLKFNKDGKAEWIKTFGQPDKDDQVYRSFYIKMVLIHLLDILRSYGTNGDVWMIRTNRMGNNFLVYALENILLLFFHLRLKSSIRLRRSEPSNFSPSISNSICIPLLL